MNFLKTLTITVLTIIFSNFLNAKDINPSFTYIASGGVNDLVLKKDKLYAATSASSIDIFDINTKTKIQSIKIKKIKDFMGDVIDSKIYSVDVKDNSLLILSQGNKGGRNIDIYKDEKFENIIPDTKRLFIAKAKYLDDSRIIYALLSNQIFIYNLKTKKIQNEIQVSHSKFSDFVLTEDKSKVIVADESGNLKMFSTNDLKLLQKYEKQNVDNVFQVDTKNSMIITAGQDRRSAIFSLEKTVNYYKQFEFLIYSVGLSPSAELAGVASNEQNDVTIFNTKTKSHLHTLKQNPALLSNILFINENEVLVSCDQEKINYYKLK